MKNSVHKVLLPINKSQMIRHLAINFILKSKIPKNEEWPRDVQIMHKALNGKKATINFLDAGTPLRICTALLCTQKELTLNGDPRLQERPLKPLLQTLESLGARFEFHQQEYTLPFTIVKSILPFNKASIDGSLSSQFISALLLLACTQKEEVSINLLGKSSGAYINQTIEAIRQHGAMVKVAANAIKVFNQKELSPHNTSVEKDYSSLPFLLNLALKRPQVDFSVEGLNPNSVQADKKALDIYKELGFDFLWKGGILEFRFHSSTQKELLVNIEECIDLAPALIAACAFLEVKLTLVGYKNLKLKESNRIEAMNANLSQLGLCLEEKNQTLSLKGALKPVKDIAIKSFNDHRIVMAMGLFALDQNWSCDNKACVSKSFPAFWEEFKKVEKV